MNVMVERCVRWWRLLVVGFLCLQPNIITASPNIILVLVDDLGWSDLSCFGGTRSQTPNIDQLAKEGIRFSQFYVNSPICSPSRVAFATGQYPQRWGIESYLDNREANKKRGMKQWLSIEAPMLARSLQEAGYRTGHFGKWHMGGQRDVDDAPAISEYGFHSSLTNFEGMGPKLLPLTEEPGWEKPRKIWEQAERLGGPVTWMKRSDVTGGYVSSAIDFISAARQERKSFYINVWPDDVHSPFFPSLEKWSNKKQERYSAVLSEMDKQLGKLFDFIREDPELRDNTLIIFCSDNGPEHGAGSCEPLRGAKTWLYEGGVRSPLIVWGPRIVSDKVGEFNRDSYFCALDINRSLYSICGLSGPQATDGEDIRDTLLGKSDQSRKSPIFWRRPPDRPGYGFGWNEPNPDLAVRQGPWKCYSNFAGTQVKLYNVVKDVEEQFDLSSTEPGIAEELRSKMLAWDKAMKSQSTLGKP